MPLGAREWILETLDRRAGWMEEIALFELAMSDERIGCFLDFVESLRELVGEGRVLSRHVVVGAGDRVLSFADTGDDIAAVLAECRQHDPSAKTHVVLRVISSGGAP